MKRFVPAAATLTFAVLLTALSAGATTVSASAQSSHPKAGRPAGPIAFAPAVLRNIAAQRAADKVGPAAEAGLKDRFAGIAIAAAGSLQISVTAMPPAAFRSSMRRAAGPVPINYRLVTHSQQALDTLTQRIARDRSWWAMRGVSLSGWGPGYASNKVVVSLTRYTRAAAAAIVRRYGASLVEVKTVSVPLASRLGRTNDTSPFFGGDRITNVTRNLQCTSGFTVRNVNDAHFALTAGHCGNINDNIHVGSLFMGLIGNRIFSQRGWDAAIIATGSSAVIWGGGANTSLTREVVSVASTDPIGGLICTDGSFTGEVCSVRIDAVNQCITFSDGITTCHLVTSSRPGVTIVQAGDSGGPVETTIPNTSNTEARGEIIGDNGNSTCYYHPIKAVAAQFSLTVLVVGGG